MPCNTLGQRSRTCCSKMRAGSLSAAASEPCIAQALVGLQPRPAHRPPGAHSVDSDWVLLAPIAMLPPHPTAAGPLVVERHWPIARE